MFYAFMYVWKCLRKAIFKIVKTNIVKMSLLTNHCWSCIFYNGLYIRFLQTCIYLPEVVLHKKIYAKKIVCTLFLVVTTVKSWP